jgi:hypothetical protein
VLDLCYSVSVKLASGIARPLVVLVSGLCDTAVPYELQKFTSVPGVGGTVLNRGVPKFQRLCNTNLTLKLDLTYCAACSVHYFSGTPLGHCGEIYVGAEWPCQSAIDFLQISRFDDVIASN